MTHKKTFSHSFATDPDKVAAFFEALIEGFRKRELSIRSEDREVHLYPAEILDMSLTATNRNGRTKISLNINWPDTHRRSSNSLPLSPPELHKVNLT